MSQVLSIKEEVKKQLPYGLETTADLILEFMSRSKDAQQRDTATFIKTSKKMPEMIIVFDFAMSLLKHNVIPIRESIYDTSIDGIKELNDHWTGIFQQVLCQINCSNYLNRSGPKLFGVILKNV